jgi:hypothetical protein
MNLHRQMAKEFDNFVLLACGELLGALNEIKKTPKESKAERKRTLRSTVS